MMRLKLLCSGDPQTLGCLREICRAPERFVRELLEAFLEANEVKCIPAPGGEDVRCVRCGNRGCVFEVKSSNTAVRFTIILVGDGFYCIPGEYEVEYKLSEAE